MEKWFRKEFGSKLTSTTVGYMGGKTKNPTYEDVKSSKTNHAEVIQMTFSPEELPYTDLLEFFWRIHDPTTANRQGNDVGSQYRSVVFAHSEAQRDVALQVMEKLRPKWKDPIVTEIVEAPPTDFMLGEEYHQKYLDKNPGGYCNHKLRW